MAPVCTNCNGTDFVWANELKTGMTGASLSLRTRGEIPLGTRICRTCGHADLFLRDISILHQPNLWRPGEFIPIVPKPATHASSHHATHHAPEPPSAPVIAAGPEAPMAPPPPPPPEPVEAMAAVPDPPPAAMSEDAASVAGPGEVAPKPKSSRRRSGKPKS